MRGDEYETKNAIYSNIETNIKIKSKTVKIVNKVVQQVLETNPFLELKSPKNYDTQQFIESISNKRSLKDDLYLQLSACTRPYNEDLMDYLIESLDDSGFLSYPIDQYLTDLDIDREMLDAHLDILRSFEPNGVGAADANDSTKK